MILRIPDYYDEFRCIADSCKDSCCIGWELDIDEESYERYRKTTGEIGKKLKKWMVEGSDETGECNTFRLNGNRCPFLNEKNLCELYIELGEDSLCNVCGEYPRFKVEYRNTVEKSLALSCEAVGELLFHRRDRIRFVERELPGEEKTEGGEVFFVEEIEAIRNRAITLLQDRDRKIEERVQIYLTGLTYAQECLNRGEFPHDRLFSEETCEEKNVRTEEEGASLYKEICDILEGMEVLDEEWEKSLSELKTEFQRKELKSLIKEIRNKEESSVWQEQLLVYFTFRYFTKAVYDADILSKGKFVLFSFLVILMMLTVRRKRTGKVDTEDIIDVCRIYSKEVEHSDENLAYLMEEFLFSDLFNNGMLRNEVTYVWN